MHSNLTSLSALALAIAMTAGCGDNLEPVGGDAAPGEDAAVPGLPGDWDAEVRLPVAEDINPDPAIVEVEIVAAVTEVEILPGVTTSMYTYNGSFPGPVIEGNVGDTLIVHFTNNLPEETTIHWHGVEVPANMDGSNIAQLAVPGDGGTFTYQFELLRASTYWYHPHIRSNEQVERGLYGALIVRDPDQDGQLGLPADELILLLDDVLLDAGGQIEAPFPTDPIENARVQFNGREGNTLVVNGAAMPTVKAFSGQPIRMRLINPSNARFMRVSIPGHVIHRVGGDGGLLTAPIASTPIALIADPDDPQAEISDPDPARGLLLVPGERADAVFTPIGGPGDELIMEWHDIPRGLHRTFDNGGSVGFGDDPNDGKRSPDRLLRFELAPGSAPDAEPYDPPEALGQIAPIDAAGAPTLPVTFGHSPPDASGNVTFFATFQQGTGGIPFDALSVNQALSATIGDTRVIEVTNLTGGDHPFHLHGFFFQHIETEFIDMDTPANNRIEPAAALEDKDTILVPRRTGAFQRSRAVVRLAVRFDDTGREGEVAAEGKVPTADSSGGWVLHCHILEHADRGMMSFLNLRAP